LPNNPRLSAAGKLRSHFGRFGGLTMSRGWLRRHVWVAPLLGLVTLLVAGTWMRGHVERAIEDQAQAQLTALLDADVKALKLWLKSEAENAQAAADDPEVRKALLTLVEIDKDGTADVATLLQAPAAKELAAQLKQWTEPLGYSGYTVIDIRNRLVASTVESMVGQHARTDYLQFVTEVLKGKSLVSRPFPSLSVQPDEWGGMSAGVPVMFAAAPVRDDAGQVMAVLGFRIRPDQEFTEILNTARFGETGEAYAFDSEGLFLSRSRFEDQMKEIGLLADQLRSRSVLSVELRDPGVDMTRGEKPNLRRSEQPLTTLAKSATTEKKKGVNAVGYRDYRGVPTVGAWDWLPDYGMGVAVEMDRDELLRPVYIVRRVFWALFALLAALTLGLLAFTLLAGRLERRVREAVLAAGKLGQYALEEKIGEGGMGSVYKARHALLRRPTAVKLLEPRKTTELAVARFEREVQLTSQLNHPNTITIYDYGRTDEGVFYYAMEYLDGFSLQSLVERFGPQPDGRVIQILSQVCGSLLEAHTAGLMHRDIKPANIMITCRGGVRDFVKLLDFGLVKATDSRRETQLTAADSITGTPLYLPPECIQDPDQADARSDLYSLGGVGYFLLTGRPVFEAASVLEIIRRQVETPPQAISEIVRRPVSPELEKLLLSCLAKSPADRPQSAAIMAETLRTMQPLDPWSLDDAHQWWSALQPGGSGSPTANSDTVTRNVEMGATMGFTNIRSMD